LDIFAFAMKMEEDGRNYYLEVAEKTSDTGLKNILNMLANDELKHYEILREMKTKASTMAATQVLENAKNIFAEMNPSELESASTQSDLYRKAQELEKKSRNFYLDKSEEVEGEDHRSLFQQLAEEERKHYFLLENIIELLLRPKTWLEDAEFSNLDDY
jgi:rubrerythrin